MTMRLLHLNICADPVGGAEIYALGLVDELRRRGHEVGFFGTSPHRSERSFDLCVVQRPINDKRLLLQDPVTLQAFSEYLEEHSPDLVHVHGIYTFGIDLLRRLAESGIPVVQTVHDFALLCPNSWCVRGDGTSCPGGAGAQCFQNDCKENFPFDAKDVLFTRFREELVRRCVRAFLCPSHHLVQTLSNRGFQNVHHVPYFADVQLSADDRPRKDNQLIFLGRLNREKGLDSLLRAMPAVVEQLPEVKLSIVGEGPHMETLVQLTRELSLTGSVDFPGKVTHENVQELMRTSTAGVVPSIWTENSPVMIYESMIAGLPMIGSRIGGIPDLIDEGRTGFLFEPRNEEEIAACILRFLSLGPDQRRAFSEAARIKGQGYTREKNVLAVESCYARALDPAGSGPPPARATVSYDDDLQAILHQLLGELYSWNDMVESHISYIHKLENDIRFLEKVIRGESHGRGQRVRLKQGVRALARALRLPKIFD